MKKKYVKKLRLKRNVEGYLMLIVFAIMIITGVLLANDRVNDLENIEDTSNDSIIILVNPTK